MQFIKDAREGKYAIGRNSGASEADEWIPGLNKSKKSKKRF